MEQVQIAKSLLEIGARIEDLEASLMISATANGSFEEVQGHHHDSDESDEDPEDAGVAMRSLERHSEQYLTLMMFCRRHNPTQPYILGQTDRIVRIKSTLSLDLEEP